MIRCIDVLVLTYDDIVEALLEGAVLAIPKQCTRLMIRADDANRLNVDLGLKSKTSRSKVRKGTIMKNLVLLFAVAVMLTVSAFADDNKQKELKGWVPLQVVQAVVGDSSSQMELHNPATRKAYFVAITCFFHCESADVGSWVPAQIKSSYLYIGSEENGKIKRHYFKIIQIASY